MVSIIAISITKNQIKQSPTVLYFPRKKIAENRKAKPKTQNASIDDHQSPIERIRGRLSNIFP